ncbi:MAG: aldose 1-epimerase [Cytophagaceae bacterium]|jgi:aldose 1-epimerase|nr:aldose 1-epimerase [Cytophagaceae bacterium]
MSTFSSVNEVETDLTFSIEKKTIGNHTEVLLTNLRTMEQVSILPSLGATINRLHLRKGYTLHSVIEGAYTPSDLEASTQQFKGAFLFPFPNRIRDGKYSFENQDYELPINFPQEGNSIHGLLLTKEFTIKEERCTEREAALVLDYKSKGETGYPFAFLIRIEFVLSAIKGFGCNTQVINLNTQDIPVALGWHPYFCMGENIDDCGISFPARLEFLVDNQMIPNGEKVPSLPYFQEQALKGIHLDTCFALEGQQPCVVGLRNMMTDTRLVVWLQSGPGAFSYLQLYTPPNRKTIAIEPMTSAPDSFNNGAGLIRLSAGDRLECSFGVYLE